jgi:acyl carrier protein
VDVKRILKDYITQELMYESNDVVLEEHDNLLGFGLLDSLNILQLVYFVENRFNLQIPQEDVIITQFSSIKGIVDYLEERGKQADNEDAGSPGFEVK